jgi:hypothetical protein
LAADWVALGAGAVAVDDAGFFAVVD